VQGKTRLSCTFESIELKHTTLEKELGEFASEVRFVQVFCAFSLPKNCLKPVSNGFKTVCQPFQFDLPTGSV
jgi:hypothetical protein